MPIPREIVPSEIRFPTFLFPFIPWVSAEDMVVTGGCTEALSLSLKAVAGPGDTVMVESPADPWLRQTIKDSNMYALEIPTHPDRGIDLGCVEKALSRGKISSCILNANCQNPLGFIMPEDHKKKVVDLICGKNIPIIENDVCGELYFGDFRPNPLKRWDTRGMVLYCSSFSKVLAPGLRLGWVLPGRYMEKVKRMKLNRSLISPKLNQVLVGSYLKGGGYPRHLRRLRRIIKLQHSYCARAVTNHFPETMKMTSPSGGLCLWIELPKGVKGRDVYHGARKMGISILPGFLCTSFDTFDRHIRIGYGGVWGQTQDKALERIGDMVNKMMGR